MHRELTENIIKYIKNETVSSRFAIVLYGEWGSGKTYYCEHILKSALKEHDCSMLRVSLFGAKTEEDIYDGILTTLFRLNTPKSKPLAKSVKSITKGLLNLGGIKLDINPSLFVTTLPMRNTLIVFDDTERSDFAKESPAFLGLVNDMVENYHWHVMLVRNEPFAVDNTTSEKVISNQFEYIPLTDDLYDPIAKSGMEDSLSHRLGFSAKDAIVSGIESSRQHNVRAIYRTMPLLEQVADSSIMHTESISLEAKESAFADVVKYSLLAAAGKKPSDPDKNDADKHIVDAARLRAKAEWLRYPPLAAMIHPLVTGATPDTETIQECLASYIAKEYPGTPADAAIKRLYNEMASYASMDDSEMERIAEQLTAAIKKHEYTFNWIYRVWKLNKQIRNLGFSQALSEDDAKTYIKKVIEKDPLSASRMLNEEYSAWVGTPGVERDRAFEDIVCYTEKLVTQSNNDTKEKLEKQVVNEQSGKQLVRKMEDIASKAYPMFDSIPTSYFARCFASGNGKTQYAMHVFLRATLPPRLGGFKDKNRLLNWFNELSRNLDDMQMNSNMGKLRKQWIQEDTAELKSELRALIENQAAHQQRENPADSAAKR